MKLDTFAFLGRLFSRDFQRFVIFEKQRMLTQRNSLRG